MEDSIYNHLRLLVEKKAGLEMKIIKQGQKALNRRKYTVQCIKQSECLTLSISVIDRMKKEFQATSLKFFKTMMNQYMELL